MSNILIVGKDKGQDNAFGSAQLMVSVLTPGPRGHKFYSLDYAQLGFDIDYPPMVTDTVRVCGVDYYDFVFIRDWFSSDRERSLALAMWLEGRGVPFLNREPLLNRSQSKLTQLMHMVLNGIPTTPTLNGPIAFLRQKLEEKHWGYPIVIKERGASRGNNNFLINNGKQLTTCFNRFTALGTTWKLLVQKFIANNGDYRLICYRGDIKLAIYRQRQDSLSHLNNTSQGAKASLVDIGDIKALSYYHRLHDDIIRLSNRWGRQFTGIDVIMNSDHYVILEINNMPQLETGAFVKEKLGVFLDAVECELRVSQHERS